MRIATKLMFAAAFFSAGALSVLFTGSDPPAEPEPAASPSALRDVEDAYAGKSRPESVRMLFALTEGKSIEGGNGWFGPGRGRRSWHWLAERHGIGDEGEIPPERFVGGPDRFKSLDRDSDGRLSVKDFDWRNAAETATPFSPAEILMAGARSGPDLLPKPEMIRSFFAGDLGSLNSGPEPGEMAPDFTLQADDGSAEIRMRDLIGKKPLVLVFGSITCAPFREQFAEVNEVRQRFKSDADFLFVYVREAHPADGWVKPANVLSGISVNQPKSVEARAEAANRCRESIRPEMPIVVDEIGDPTAVAYAALPARFYVIDRDGTVAFKSGRGPVGFNPREMEQALALTLLGPEPAPQASGG